jgi:hypothetical protein
LITISVLKLPAEVGEAIPYTDRRDPILNPVRVIEFVERLIYIYLLDSVPKELNWIVKSKLIKRLSYFHSSVIKGSSSG